MELPENQAITSTEIDSISIESEILMPQTIGEITVQANVSMTEITPVKQHTKVHDARQMSRHRAREAGRRSLF